MESAESVSTGGIEFTTVQRWDVERIAARRALSERAETVSILTRGRQLGAPSAQRDGGDESEESALEATAGIEPAMKVLQTSALPLGYVAPVCAAC